jgi:disulfide bond formation protein DsbB
MPYLGIGSISGIIHMIARFPHVARAVVVVAMLIGIWR